MKTLIALCTVLAATLTLAACGVEGGDDGNDNTVTPPAETPDAGTPGTDAGTPAPTYLPAPFATDSDGVLKFSTAYVSGSPCGTLVGDLPGITWDESKGVAIADKDITTGELDGYMSTVYSAPNGTYHVSYIDRACPGETRQTKGWAQYGDKQLQMPNYKAEDRAFLNCTWYDAVHKACLLNVTNPGCNIAFTKTKDANGIEVVTPAGNMRDFNLESDKDCNL